MNNDVLDDFNDPKQPPKSKFKRFMDMSFYLIGALFMIGLIIGLVGYRSWGDRITLICIWLGVAWMLLEIYRRFIYKPN